MEKDQEVDQEDLEMEEEKVKGELAEEELAKRQAEKKEIVKISFFGISTLSVLVNILFFELSSEKLTIALTMIRAIGSFMLGIWFKGHTKDRVFTWLIFILLTLCSGIIEAPLVNRIIGIFDSA